ncbi:unnamed protein product [Closterium sp. Naga37s-1]|nr:unnamed protein product [Closterium sp. Naga37s-1]
MRSYSSIYSCGTRRGDVAFQNALGSSIYDKRDCVKDTTHILPSLPSLSPFPLSHSPSPLPSLPFPLSPSSLPFTLSPSLSPLPSLPFLSPLHPLPFPLSPSSPC